ncbi:hypothetical protein [uncultured Winogradskyella sp.]|uniref:hypothetical protein n=1 Tax=uncultured Winogradskyella sp. TaxID=395353 RepID=UPI0030DCE96D|tara:strand:- start:720 stop:2111 length:1392 start_codon:yes stop_codon:yes gene_type:complete
MRIKFRFSLLLLFVISCQFIQAQIDSVNTYLNSAKQAYKLGDYAVSTLYFEKALVFSNNLSENHKDQKALKLEALKGLITVSGMGSAIDLSIAVYEKHRSFVFQNLCSSKQKAIKIGLINNFIAVAYHNNYTDEAIKAYQDFINYSNNCTDFRDVNKVQASANAVLAFAKLKKTKKAVELLPLLSYYVDSLPNWTKADYEKVLAKVKSKTNSSTEEIINHYKNAANDYNSSHKYSYELNVYETLLKDYAVNLSNKELMDIIEKSKIAKGKTPYYHSEQYNKMMKEFGILMLERSASEIENQQLKNYSFILVTLALLIIISLLFIANKGNREKKNVYQQLYNTEKQFKLQQEKLTQLKHNFVKQNYVISLVEKKNSSKSFYDLCESLIKNFPQLNYNIQDTYTGLTKKEIKIIYLSLLDISNKESASLLHLTYGSYRVAKNRLLKKMKCTDINHFDISIKKLLS